MAAADTEPKLDEFVGEDSMGACVLGGVRKNRARRRIQKRQRILGRAPLLQPASHPRPSSPHTHLTDEEEFVEEVGKEKKLTVSVKSARLENF